MSAQEPTNGSRRIALTSTRTLIDGSLQPGTVIFDQVTGRITHVLPFHSRDNKALLQPNIIPGQLSHTSHTQQLTSHSALADQVIDVSPQTILPGLVDTHVHLNEPGRTQWEGFETGTKAAVAGGVTTLVDMPLNSIPPTTSVAALEEKAASAQGKAWCDIGFYGGIVPSNVGNGELKRMVQAGVMGFKGFMCPSGVDEFESVNENDILAAMRELDGEPTMLMLHAETDHDDIVAVGQPEKYSTFLASRPSSLETDAIARIINLAPNAPNLHLHIVHLSAAESIPLLRDARASGINITAETCFHYLARCAEDIKDGDARIKCCPPVRDRANMSGLWRELLKPDSMIQTIVSDHSPCTPDVKLLSGDILDSTTTKDQKGAIEEDEDSGNLLKAWGGITSLGLGLPILNTIRQAGTYDFSLADIIRWCAENCAAQVGLGGVKGKLAVGYDADIVVFDDQEAWTVEGRKMYWRNKATAYEGAEMVGKAKQTWLRGRRVFDAEHGFEETKPSGRLLLEPR